MMFSWVAHNFGYQKSDGRAYGRCHQIVIQTVTGLLKNYAIELRGVEGSQVSRGHDGTVAGH